VPTASGPSSARSSGSAAADPPLTSEVVIQGGTVKDPQNAYLMAPAKESDRAPSNAEESETEGSDSDSDSLVSSVADFDSGDSDGGSVQVDTDTNYANDEGSATALLLNKRIAYSDTNGLRYPEGNRLSLILATKESSPSNSPNTKGTTSMSTAVRSSAIGGEAIAPAVVLTGENLTSRQRAESTKMLAFGHHPWTARPDGGINSRSSDGKRGNEIYYCGIIDILQAYDMRKQTESIIKGFYQDRKKISSVNPDAYAARFTEFMDENID